MLGKNFARTHMVFFDNPPDLFIDSKSSCLTVILNMAEITTEENLALFFTEGQRPKLVAHSPLTDHFARNKGHPLQIV